MKTIYKKISISKNLLLAIAAGGVFVAFCLYRDAAAIVFIIAFVVLGIFRERKEDR